MKNRKATQDSDYLIFTISNQLYALPYYNLVQIIDSPTPTVLPNSENHVRGAINFLGELVVLYDLRKALGMASLADEVSHTVAALAERKKDHINWINRLKDEVYHDRDISVQTDPHKCAFGLWYDGFRPDSISLAEYMSRFDAPHKHIHGIATKAKELIAVGQKQKARDLIHDAEQAELKSLITLFENVEHNIRTFTFEYAVVIENAGKKFALSVDAVKSFERFDEISSTIPPMLRKTGGDFLHGFGRRNTNGRTEEVLILDVGKIISLPQTPSHRNKPFGNKEPTTLRDCGRQCLLNSSSVRSSRTRW